MQQVLFALIGSLPFLVAQCPQPTPPGASFADATRISDWDEASSERTYPIDAEFDCGVRKLALEYASKVLQDVPDAKQALAQVHDALQLKTCSASIGDVHASKYLLSSSFEASRYDATTTEYYVSPQGSDTNSGTEGSPFRTIERARDEIRKTSANERKSISVILREGTYYLNGTLFLEPQDSGVSNEMPITYRAYQGESVVVSGGMKLDLDWTKQGDNVYRATVSDDVKMSSLFRDGNRLKLARFPNGDASVPQPEGYINAGDSGGGSGEPGTMVPVNTKVINRHNNEVISTGTVLPLDKNHTLYVDTPMYHKGSCAYFEAFEGGALSRYNTSLNRPLWNSKVDMAFHYDPSTWTKRKWANAHEATVHMFHTHFWGGWAFDVDSIDTSSHLVKLSRGGFQEARGGAIQKNLFYVENVFEELDDEGEFYYDSTNRTLYLYSEKDPRQSVFETALLETLVAFRGSANMSVKHVTFDGLTFRHSTPTFMSSYEPPPSGDWAIHRGGMVFLDGAENITISHCIFDQPGGNAVFLSNHVKYCAVKYNNILDCGDNAVAAVGSTMYIDGTADTQPSYNLIANNHMAGVGIYGKQTSMYFQAVARLNMIRNNVMYRGPRAGVNFNDGFGGGNLLQGNLIFNVVRETWDHGPFNSWDREIFYFKDSSGNFTTEPEYSHLDSNFLINRNFGLGHSNSDKLIDHDDGSSSYIDTNNVLIYGGIKNRDGNRRQSSNNLIVYADTFNASFGILQPYFLGPMGAHVNSHYTRRSDSFSNNTIVSHSGAFIAVKDAAWLDGNIFPETMNNHYFTPGNASLPFVVPGYKKEIKSLEEWQKDGHDQGSTISSKITNAEILEMARAKLGM